jgi:hypothetical protein
VAYGFRLEIERDFLARRPAAYAGAIPSPVPTSPWNDPSQMTTCKLERLDSRGLAHLRGELVHANPLGRAVLAETPFRLPRPAEHRGDGVEGR